MKINSIWNVNLRRDEIGALPFERYSVRYYLLPNSTAWKLSNQEKIRFENIWYIEFSGGYTYFWTTHHHHHHVALSARIFLTLSRPLPIVHCFWQVFRATASIGTELLFVGSSWTSCLCSSLWRGPQEYITYELVPTSPAVSRMSGSSNFDSFRDGR